MASKSMRDGRWSDAAISTAIKMLVGAAIGGALATGLSLLADSANAQAIATNSAAIVSNTRAITMFREQVLPRLAVISAQQEDLGKDIDEIKVILREKYP